MSSKGSPAWIAILMRKGSPNPRLMSNTFEPMAFETAISPNPSLATRMELRQSYHGKKKSCKVVHCKEFYVTHRDTCSNSNDHQAHDKLINVEDAPHTSHKRDHGKAYNSNPKDGHGEGGSDDVPFAILGAVGDGPGEQNHKGK